MRHDIDLVLHLGLLDQLSISPHPLLGVGLGEDVGDERGGVQAGEGDELPAVAEFGEALDVRLLLVARHGRLPVEGGREVVRESVGNRTEVSGAHPLTAHGAGDTTTYFCSGHTACTPLANSSACL